MHIYTNQRFRYSKIAEYMYNIIRSAKDERAIFYMEENIEDIVQYIKENEKNYSYVRRV